MAELTRDTGRVARALLEGGIAAFPTETVYGLGAVATDEGAVRKVFEAKRRPADIPLIVHLPDFGEAGKWAAGIPDLARRLAGLAMPGPLTLVLRKSERIPPVVTAGRDTVALRVPSHPVAQELLRRVGKPIAAPSANLHGRPSATEPAHVLADFGGADFLVLDGGCADIGIESAIVDLSAKGGPVMLRSGPALSREVLDALGEGLEDRTAAANPGSPGGSARHYSPAKPFRVVDPAGLAGQVRDDPGCGLVSFARPEGHRGPWRKGGADPAEYARTIYSFLRELDGEPCRTIVAERPPRGPAWAGVNDRLARAAAR